MKTIVVPLSSVGQKLLDLDQATSSDLCEVTLTQDEFIALWNSGVFNEINSLCDAWIDEYEDASICGTEKLTNLIRLLKDRDQREGISVSSGVAKLLKMAICANSYKTGVYFYF